MASSIHCEHKEKTDLSQLIVIQLIIDAKNKARALPSKEIEKFFKCVKKGNT